MSQPGSILRRVGSVLYAIAIILGVLLILSRAIPDLESTMYGFFRFGYPSLSSLDCPVLMTTQDTEPVTIKLHNTLSRDLTYYVKAEFSSPVLIVDHEQQLTLAPGEARTLSWNVDHNNLSEGNFIFAHIYVSAATVQGMREGTCGTFALPLPIQGGPAIFYGSLIAVVVAGGLGLWLWLRYNILSAPSILSQANWMRFTAVLIAIGLVLAILGIWFFAILVVFVIALSSAVFLIPAKV